MKLIPYDKSKLGSISYARTKNYKILQEFIDSDYDCVKVENYSHKDAKGCNWCLSASIKRYHLDGIKCVLRNGEVFLIKKELED